MDQRALQHLLRHQDGLLNRRQALQLGLDPGDVRRLVRRREWARVHPGVYVDHTGPLTWQQRAWAAVLCSEPAVLCAGSALRAVDGPGRRSHDDAGPIHVAIDAGRTATAPAGVVVHRVRGLSARSHWNTAPPRLRIEEAIIDVAAAAPDDFAAVAVMADAVQSRRTTARRIERALADRSRVARRQMLRGVLEDIATGACSALEHAYLTRVERPHGLPRARRQTRASARGPVYRDVLYDACGVVVELDGRTDHTRSLDRARDLDRDLRAALDDLVTVRLGWGQAVGRPCETAADLGALLALRGWRGAPRRCTRCPDR